MAQYTVEPCELLMNDENFGEMDSADSLDDSFSDSTNSCSDPENDFSWKNCSCDYPTTKGSP